MSYFSNISTALDEKQHGRGREAVCPGAVGVCLDDSGVPVKLYIVDTVYSDSLDVFSIDNDFGPDGALHDDAKPRQVTISDFWALV